MPHKLLNELKDIEHVIWDWNGTLLNDVDHAVSIANELLTDHKLPLITREHYRQVFDFPVKKYYESLGFNFEKETFSSLCDRFVEKFMAGVHKLPLVELSEKVLHTLHKQGVKQSVLSASDQPNLDKMMKDFKIDHIFSFVYGLNDKLASSKVERGRELLKVSGVPTSKTVIIGDTLHDLEVAQALGIEAVLVGHGAQCPTRLKRVHHRVI